jgi:hypothetical protein
MVRPIAMPMNYDPAWHTPWAGMYQGNSWTTKMQRPEQITLKLSRIKPGTFLKGHLGYWEPANTLLYWSGITKYFMYRDFRDVAVSQAYHIMSDNAEAFSHPIKDELRALGLDKVLEHVIVGKDIYAGIFERWELYAPWLEEEWVMKVRFEDLLHEPLPWAKKIVEHFLDRTEFVLNIPRAGRQIEGEQLEDIAMEMVATSLRTAISPTFRKGITGEWKTHFNDRHKFLFKETDVNNWLVELGYEKDRDW